MSLPDISKVFFMDPVARTILPPQLMLTTRSFKPLGLIKYTNWNFSLVANGMDEFTFDVYKPEDITEDMDPKKKLLLTYEKKVWDNLVDLKLILIQDYGRFEISVNYTDNTKTVKSVHAVSLECELSQILLHDFHVNDDEAMATMEANEYNKEDFDYYGNFIPTTLCNFSDERHSLVHRVLADKAPHWTIGNQEKGTGYFTPFVTFDKDEDCELSKEFQRTYTCNGESIYEFLTNTVANEANVVFVFDTINRVINCYSACDCITQHNKELRAAAIGEDTNVFLSKEKLVNEISITSKKDNVKNCFRVEGGDDYINAMVAVANVNGSNYITQFSEFQYDDMSEELKDILGKYEKAIKKAQPEYEKKYLQLCAALDDLYDKESGKMPSVSTEDETASDQASVISTKLKKFGTTASYNSESHVGATNGIESLARIYVTSNYDIEIVNGSTSYTKNNNEEDNIDGTWKGTIKITNSTDEKDTAQISATVTVIDDDIRICEQKIEKALAKGDMVSFKFIMDKYLGDDYKITDSERANIEKYLYDNYCLNRLISFYDAYETCVSTLIDMGKNKSDSAEYNFYLAYVTIRDAIGAAKKKRQSDVDGAKATVDRLSKECSDFQAQYDMETYLGRQCYLEYCAYRREDTYSNPNYISDGLSDSECIKKAKELLEVARKEIKKACVLQRTLEIDLNNLLLLEEFKPLWNKFSMYNYVRLETDDEILKLRLIGLDINGTSLSSVNVTFSDQIENVDGDIDDLQSIMEQAKDMGSSFPSTIRQVKKNEEASAYVGSLRKNGLIAAQTLISNADNNEVTYGGFGILCRNQGDSGDYGEKQLRVIGNGIYLTTDSWKTVEMCIGEINLCNDEGQCTEKYGIIADTIVAGTIIGGDGGTYWNLDTGEFVMSSSSGGVKDETTGEVVGLNSFIANTAQGYIESYFSNENGDFANIRSDIKGIKAEFKENGRVGKLEATASGLVSEFTDEDGRVSKLEHSVEGFNNVITGNDQTSTLWSTINEFGSDLTKVENVLKGMTGQIEAIGDYYFYFRFSSSPASLTNESNRTMTIVPEENSQSVGVALSKSTVAPSKSTEYKWYNLGGTNGYKAIVNEGTDDEIIQYLHIKFSDDGKLFSKNYISTDFAEYTLSGNLTNVQNETVGRLCIPSLIKVEPGKTYRCTTNHSSYRINFSYYSSNSMDSYLGTATVVNNNTYKMGNTTNYICVWIQSTVTGDDTSYEEYKTLFENGSIIPEIRLSTETKGETIADYIGTYVNTTEADSSTFNDYLWQRAANTVSIKNMRSYIKQTADSITSRVESIEGDYATSTEIQQLSDNILLKAESTDLENGQTIASLINIDSDEVYIRGQNIKLEGTVTANESFKVLTDGSAEAANLTVENEISAYTLNVETINNGAYQKTLSGNVVMYVDAVNGSDESSCEYNAVFQTLQAAVNSIPKFMNGKTVQIELRSDIAENVYVKSLIGGWLEIYLGGYIINGLIRNRGCELVSYYGGTISGGGTNKTGTIHSITGVDYSGYFCSIGYDECNYGYLGNLNIYAPDSSNNKSCIGIQSGGSVTCNNIKIINADYGFVACLGGHLHINKSSGIAKQYGFVAVKGGVITLSSTYTDSSGKKITHAGGVTNSYTEYHGGTVKFHEQTYFEGKDTSGSQTTDSKPATKPSTKKTITCKSDSVKSIRNYNKSGEKWRSDTSAKTGMWSSEYGYHAAFWFFGNQFDDALASNATINSIKIKYSRESGGNHSQNVTHYFYGHTHTSRPSDPTKVNVISTVLDKSSSIKAGESATVSLSSSAINAFKTNKCRGICCIAPNENQSSYSVMGGSMTVTITYTVS